MSLVALSLLLTTGQCMIFFIIFLFFRDFVAATILNNLQIKPFLLLIPVSIILSNVYTTLTFYANRRKYYSYISQGSINQGIGINLSKLLFAFTDLTRIGLIFEGLSGNLHRRFNYWCR